MREGRRINAAPALTAIREYAAGELAGLPPPLRELRHEPAYPVLISEPLRDLAAALDAGNPEHS
jgi:nicotinate phosphoribosyltransferase